MNIMTEIFGLGASKAGIHPRTLIYQYSEAFITENGEPRSDTLRPWEIQQEGSTGAEPEYGTEADTEAEPERGRARARSA